MWAKHIYTSLCQNRLPAICAGVILMFLCLCGFMFLETRTIQTRYHVFQLGTPLRIVVLGDIHGGIYKKKDWVEHVVAQINAIPQVDAVLIAGDFLYYADDEHIREFFEPLSRVKYPLYSVLGNHDLERSDTQNRRIISQTLSSYGTFLENTSTIIENSQGNRVILTGLGDDIFGEDDVSVITESELPSLVLAHSPDTVMKYTNQKVQLTITGHTHCGQIRVPYVYKSWIPVEGNFDKGFQTYGVYSVFTTCGVGEVLLPFRLNNPPSIDVIDMY